MSPLPEDSSSAARPAAIPPEFSPEERDLLLRMAREAVASTLERREFLLVAPSAHLAQLRGVFTTLYVREELHGCVGFALPTTPLYLAVAQTAKAAAFEDRRFPPLTREEIPDLKISLSVLSPLQPILPDEIEIGRHGLLISSAGRRGLLLPQVPIERGWDGITFLEQTCHKAGLPANAWRSGANLEAFTAEVFGDEG